MPIRASIVTCVPASQARAATIRGRWTASRWRRRSSLRAPGTLPCSWSASPSCRPPPPASARHDQQQQQLEAMIARRFVTMRAFATCRCAAPSILADPIEVVRPDAPHRRRQPALAAALAGRLGSSVRAAERTESMAHKGPKNPERSFGLSVGAVLLLIAAYAVWRGRMSLARVARRHRRRAGRARRAAAVAGSTTRARRGGVLRSRLAMLTHASS